MLFKDNQFKSNKLVHVCFYMLLCLNIILFICFIGILVSGCFDKDMPWYLTVILEAFVLIIFFIILIAMLAMRFKKLEIDEEKIVKTTILNKKKIIYYQASQLSILIEPTFSLNRGLKLTFFLEEKKIMAYDLIESVTSNENFQKRRATWAKDLSKIGCLIIDPTHCLG